MMSEEWGKHVAVQRRALRNIDPERAPTRSRLRRLGGKHEK